jgi:hypothetical protein
MGFLFLLKEIELHFTAFKSKPVAIVNTFNGNK